MFPVIWATIACWGITMAGSDDFNFHRFSASNGGIEIIYLKPQQDSVSIRPGVWITDAAMMMGHIPPM
jgi:hypothetical protein